MKRWWCIACVDMKKICANLVVIATTYLLFTHTAVWKPQLLWADVNCNVYFSYIGNQVWYVLTGANFMHVACLLWVWLSLLCVTTTQALDVTASMPHRNTMLVFVERGYVTVERITRHYTLFLCQKWSLKSGNTCPSRWDVCLFWVVSSGFYGARFMEMASRDIRKLLATLVDLWNRHWCQCGKVEEKIFLKRILI